MEGLTDLERAVLDKLSDGENEIFRLLRKQCRSAQVTERHLTGVGFWTYFSVGDKDSKLPGEPSFRFGDVDAEIIGLKNGAGFVLLIKHGFISMLEGYSFDELWPADTRKFNLFYEGSPKRNEEEVIRSFSPA